MDRMTVFAISRWEIYSMGPNFRKRMRICRAGFTFPFPGSSVFFAIVRSEVIFPALSELSG